MNICTAKSHEHSPSRAGEVLLAQAVAARKELIARNKAAIKASGKPRAEILEAIVVEMSRIRGLDHKEVARELKNG